MKLDNAKSTFLMSNTCDTSTPQILKPPDTPNFLKIINFYRESGYILLIFYILIKSYLKSEFS